MSVEEWLRYRVRAAGYEEQVVEGLGATRMRASECQEYRAKDFVWEVAIVGLEGRHFDMTRVSLLNDHLYSAKDSEHKGSFRDTNLRE